MKNKILKFLLIFLPTFLIVFLSFKFGNFSFLKFKEDQTEEIQKKEISFKIEIKDEPFKKNLPEKKEEKISPEKKEDTPPQKNEPPFEKKENFQENLLLIDKFKIKVPILVAKSEKKEDILRALQNGTVLHPSFSMPGEKGLVVIYGHSSRPLLFPGKYNTIFASLINLEEGDEILIFFNQKKYLYKVNKKIIFYPQKEDEVLPKKTNEKLLLLITCWPPKSDRQRLGIIAKLQD